MHTTTLSKQFDRQRGFTMIEMIGVLAVIAILASIVAPKIFDAIRDAKNSAVAEDIATVRTAVASYYKDTGQWPYQETAGVNSVNADLLKNRATPTKGWRGPYLDKALTNPIQAGQEYRVWHDNSTFDIDGDGTNDYTTNNSYMRIFVQTPDQAKAISNAIDSDGDNTTGNTAWYKAGRVRTSNSTLPTGANVLYVFLGHF